VIRHILLRAGLSYQLPCTRLP